MKYLFDNNISHRYADMLAALGVEASSLRREFPESIQDVDLFKAIAGRDDVFVSGDLSIRTRAAEAAELRACGVSALFLGPFWAKMVFWKQAEWLVRRWPIIDGFCRGAARGTCAEIKQNGRAMPFRL